MSPWLKGAILWVALAAIMFGLTFLYVVSRI
jgi:hypothetical protein